MGKNILLLMLGLSFVIGFLQGEIMADGAIEQTICQRVLGFGR